MGERSVGTGNGAPRSERVQVVPDWSFEECGAGNDVERVWLYKAQPGVVTFALERDGRGVMCAVPCAVLAHVMRVCERDADAVSDDDAGLDVAFGCMMMSERA